jgi:hypothetical protein
MQESMTLPIGFARQAQRHAGFEPSDAGSYFSEERPGVLTTLWGVLTKISIFRKRTNTNITPYFLTIELRCSLCQTITRRFFWGQFTQTNQKYTASSAGYMSVTVTIFYCGNRELECDYPENMYNPHPSPLPVNMPRIMGHILVIKPV